MKTVTKPITLSMHDRHYVAKNVLLLEDDAEFNAAIKEYLEGDLYNIVPVQNGFEGMKALDRQYFDLIICDMMMPLLSGDMFYLAVERLNPVLRNRFIFITGFRNNPTVTSFLKSVDTVVLEKPFKLGELLESIMMVESKPHRDN